MADNLNVEAKPEPPWEVMVVCEASSPSAARIDGSTFGAILEVVMNGLLIFYLEGDA